MHAQYMTELAEKFPSMLKGLLVYIRDTTTSVWLRAYIVDFVKETQLYEIEYQNEQIHTEYLKLTHNADRKNRRRDFILDYHFCPAEENQIHFNNKRRVKFLLKI